VHERPLGDILASDAYRNVACDTVGNLRGRDGACATCRHFEQCAGGCPALALILPGGETQGVDAIGADPSKCLFFEGGWQQRTEEALAGWERT
jgi:sulfatase maturation enzyme AslB (radical SAM superfamily)